jgi:hypothetical protein
MHELTRHDDKGHGGSDGYAFQRGHHVVHTSR